MKTDQEFMQLALDLAASAKGMTNPNPLVGAVIVKDGMIVGTGLHRKAGEPHAEVHAFQMAGEHAKGATLYVTLEPCSHYGKTPPCALLVKDSGVQRVVVAMQDPNPDVAGRGIRLLQEAGIEVEVGLLEKEAKRLNERFIHNMLTNRPFVVSKFAMTLDGKLATHTGHSQWITGEKARGNVHELRNRMDAILVGVGTVVADDPTLTTRLEDRRGKNPIRVVLDSQLRTPLEANILKTDVAETIIVVSRTVELHRLKQYENLGASFIFVSKDERGLNLTELLEKLYERGITDVVVEGGGIVNASFLRANLIDKYYVYIAPKILGGKNSITPFAGENVKTMDAAMRLEFESIEHFDEDILITAYPKHEDIR